MRQTVLARLIAMSELEETGGAGESDAGEAGRMDALSEVVEAVARLIG